MEMARVIAFRFRRVIHMSHKPVDPMVQLVTSKSSDTLGREFDSR